MAELSLKQQFLRALDAILRPSGVPRKELCRQLELSPSALSQILSGAMLPTQQRLDRLFELLHPSVAEAEKLQDMLLWLRAGYTHYPSVFNRKLFLARCQSGMSLEALSSASDIPVNRLRRLERTAYAEPVPDEVFTLSFVLGYPLSDDPMMTEIPTPSQKPLQAAESDIVMLHRLSVADMRKYQGQADFWHFVDDLRRGYLAFRDIPGEAMAVLCAKTSELNIRLPGAVEVVLAGRRPSGFAELDLFCVGEERQFYIKDGDGKLVGDLVAEPSGDVIWRLPVVRMSFIPEVFSYGP